MEREVIKKENSFEKHFQTAILTLATTFIIAGYSKMESISLAVARLEERERTKSEQMLIMQADINKIKIDLNLQNDRLTRMESQKK